METRPLPGGQVTREVRAHWVGRRALCALALRPKHGPQRAATVAASLQCAANKHYEDESSRLVRFTTQRERGKRGERGHLPRWHYRLWWLWVPSPMPWPLHQMRCTASPPRRHP